MPQPDFTPFPKIHRFNRDVIITEKIDGSNAAVVITDDGDVYAQSRKRFVEPGKQDLAGFAAFVLERKDQLVAKLGPGVHFGEWYGSKIQRGYGLVDGERYFALFNVGRWSTGDEANVEGMAPWQPQPDLPDHVTTVPVLGVAQSLGAVEPFPPRPAGSPKSWVTKSFPEAMLENLKRHGSFATGADGFDNPEGIVIHHTQGNVSFKWTIHGDDKGKSFGS